MFAGSWIKLRNPCLPSRCLSTVMSWKTTTRSLTRRSFPPSLTEKVPSTTAKPQRPNCSTKFPCTSLPKWWEPSFTPNPVKCGELQPNFAVWEHLWMRDVSKTFKKIPMKHIYVGGDCKMTSSYKPFWLISPRHKIPSSSPKPNYLL